MSVKFVKLSEIAHIESGGTPSSDNPAYWNGDIHWATLVDVKNKYVTSTRRKITAEGLKRSSAKLLPIGTVLFSSRATIGEVSISKVELATNQGFKNFLCDSNRIIPEYLYFVLKFNAKKIANSVSSTTFKEISKTKLGEYKIPLCSLEEQKRFVDLFDQLNELRKKRKQAIGFLDEYLKAVFWDMFGDIETNTLGWELTNLSKITNKITDGTHQSPKFTQEGIPFIFISNIVSNEITLNTKRYISQNEYNALTKNTPIEKYDVLYTTVGSYGNPAIVKTDEKFCFQRHIAHIKPDHGKTNVYFLYAMLKSPSVKKQVDNKAKGIAQKTLNLTDLKNLIVILPPIDLQNKFGEIVKQTEQTKQKMLKQSEEMDNQFKALMQKTFRT